jgi:hypothetical protein
MMHDFFASMAGPHEVTETDIEGAHLHQIVGGDAQVAVAADGEAGSGRHGHEREQPRPVGQLQRQPGRAAVEVAFADPGASRRGAEHLFQLVIGAGDRLHLLPAAVGVADPYLVGPVGVDILDARVVQQPLQPIQAKQRVEGGVRQLVLFRRGQHRLAVSQRVVSSAFQCLGDQLAAQGLLVRSAERWAPRRGQFALAFGQCGQHLGPQPGHQRRVGVHRPASSGTLPLGERGGVSGRQDRSTRLPTAKARPAEPVPTVGATPAVGIASAGPVS